jgi:hypothetical protein
VVVVVVGGVLAGYLAGGRLRRLADLRLRSLWLLVLAAVVVLGTNFAGWAGPWPILIGGTLLLVFLAANGWTQQGGIRLGLLFMAVGWMLNLVVVTVNDGMPTPAEVLSPHEWWPNLWLMPHFLDHVPLAGTTRLSWLADSIEIRFAHILMPISPGDLLLYLGGIVFIAAAMRTVNRERQSSGVP